MRAHFFAERVKSSTFKQEYKTVLKMYYKHYKPNIQRGALLSRISGVLLCFCDIILNSHGRCTSHRLMMWSFFRFYDGWIFCPTGYFLNTYFPGLWPKRRKLQCCRPLHHPDSYGPCYYTDWGRCQLAGYYITGLKKTHLTTKLSCCKMTKTAGNSILLD